VERRDGLKVGSRGEPTQARLGKRDDVLARSQAVPKVSMDRERVKSRDADNAVTTGTKSPRYLAQRVQRSWEALERVIQNNEIERRGLDRSEPFAYCHHSG
jgi:hypothetical protein